MSSRVFQSVIVQMKDATSRTIGVADSDGFVIASGDLSLIGRKLDSFSIYKDEIEDKTIVFSGKTFKKLKIGEGDEYILFADGEDEFARAICTMAYITLNEARVQFESSYDKRAFIKNIISENIFPGEVTVRSKEFRFDEDAERAVLVIRHNSSAESTIVEQIQEIFPDRQHDFIIPVNDTDIAVVVRIPPSEDSAYIYDLAAKTQQRLLEKLALKTVIGIGTQARQLRELADRYKEALISIQVGKVFEPDQTIINYESLGIGRLIYQLPATLCEMFLSEVFKKNPIEVLDQETLTTIDKFFENSLNISEASRKMFVHRNTLVYRLEKIKKLTGLDLREFDHAIIFKVALMVNKYLKHRPDTL